MTIGYERPPLYAGGDMDFMLQRAAKEGARIALEEFRTERKKGREDAGSGNTGVGESLRTQRLEEGLSLRELGDQSGLHSTTISKIERGERGMSLLTFCRLAGVLGVSWAEKVIVEVGQWPRG